MNRRRLLLTVCLTLVLALLSGGIEQGFAQSSNAVQVSADVQAAIQERKKPVLQRRHEAKIRLQEAIEARKALRLAVPDIVMPDKDEKGGKP